MRVTQLLTRSGNPAQKQYVIIDGEKRHFQSYKTTIATYDNETQTLTFYPDKDFVQEGVRYSRTTSKYLNEFLIHYTPLPAMSLTTRELAIRTGKYWDVNVRYMDEPNFGTALKEIQAETIGEYLMKFEEEKKVISQINSFLKEKGIDANELWNSLS